MVHLLNYCVSILTFLQIQQLLVLMESETIKKSIDDLIKARPTVSTASPVIPTDLDSLTNSLDSPISREGRYSSIKRKSVALPAAKCNCGKCSKCVPSPSGKQQCFFSLVHT